MRRFLEYDPLSGITRSMDYNHATGEITEYATADSQAALDLTQKLRNDDDYWKQGVKNEMAHYAHIPNIILEKWMGMGVDIRNPDALVEMVNKPEWAYLKVTNKVVLARA